MLLHQIYEHKFIAPISSILSEIIASESITITDGRFNYVIKISTVCTTVPKVVERTIITTKTAATDTSKVVVERTNITKTAATDTSVIIIKDEIKLEQPTKTTPKQSAGDSSVHFLLTDPLDDGCCWRCKECGNDFKNEPDLFWHIRYRHLALLKIIEAPDSGQCFGCHVCQITFKTFKGIQAHYRYEKHDNAPTVAAAAASTIAAVGTLECHKCNNGRTYSTQSSLISHIRTHSEERRFMCEICSRSFKRPDSLQAHMDLHAPTKSHVCPQCGEAFQQASGLRQHSRRKHRAPLWYECDLCAKQYKARGLLR